MDDVASGWQAVTHGAWKMRPTDGKGLGSWIWDLGKEKTRISRMITNAGAEALPFAVC